MHIAEDALGWASIGILSLFVAELAAKLLVFGYTYFTRSWCACAAAHRYLCCCLR